MFTRSSLYVRIALATVVGLLLAGALQAAPLVDNVQLLLRAAVTAPVDTSPSDRLQAYDQPLRRFYADRAYRPAWIDETGMTPLAGSVIDLLRHAGDEGLDAADYRLADINRIAREYSRMRQLGWMLHPSLLADLDLLLTRGFMLYAADQISGRLDPATLQEGWETRPRPADPVNLLVEGLADPRRFGPILQELPPPHPGYRRLKEAYLTYRHLADQLGLWPTLANGPAIHPGSYDDRLPAIRRMLSLLGDLALLSEEPTYYDATTEEAVRRFQARHGLNADGVIGEDTLAELRVPPSERAWQLQLNMERWRWLPKDLGARYLMVNIAAFALDVVEGDRTVMRMAVVVGKDYRKTPVFSDRVRYLEFAPYWNVPPTILEEDLLPVIRKNPAAWFRQHYDFEVVARGGRQALLAPERIDWQRVTENSFPGVLRQRPGRDNPLGQVKFMFPNDFHVYLHDTASRGLFRRETRALSSGCIRVEKPVDLAVYLLEGQPGWHIDRVLAAMEGETTQVVRLEWPTPVHILYWTAWVDPDGTVQFRRDIYERDAILQQALTNLPRPPLLVRAQAPGARF